MSLQGSRVDRDAGGRVKAEAAVGVLWPQDQPRVLRSWRKQRTLPQPDSEPEDFPETQESILLPKATPCVLPSEHLRSGHHRNKQSVEVMTSGGRGSDAPRTPICGIYTENEQPMSGAKSR